MFMSKKQVRDFTTLSLTQIDRLEKAEKFPRRVSIGSRVVWLCSEIQAWCEERVAKDRSRGS